jgi:hypothetical protein
MDQDQELTVEQWLARLVEDVKRLMRDARALATHSQQIGEAFRRGESSETLSVDLDHQRTGRKALEAGVSRSLHEIGMLLDDMEKHEGFDWPKIISLKRERDAVVVRERPLNQIESDWVEDRLLAIEALLVKTTEMVSSNAAKSTPATVGSAQHPVVAPNVPVPTETDLREPDANQTIAKSLDYRYSRAAGETVREFIDRCRKDMGNLSVDTLADVAGVNAAQIYRLRKNQGVSQTTLSAVAGAIKCGIADLFK